MKFDCAPVPRFGGSREITHARRSSHGGYLR